MNREEIKNRLYFVAATIKMNADKFANGEALENEDWVKATKEFTSCLNYLIQPNQKFEEIRTEKENYESAYMKGDAQGKKDIGSFSPKSVKIGKQTWMSENLAIDDGGEGIYYNEKNGEYYYTWDAAVRIAKAIPGWHLPSVAEWDEACEACGVEPIGRYGYAEDARKLYDKMKVLSAGYYYGNFNYVGSFAYFCTAAEYDSGNAYSRYFSTGASMGSNSYNEYYGYSVRLVKD